MSLIFSTEVKEMSVEPKETIIKEVIIEEKKDVVKEPIITDEESNNLKKIKINNTFFGANKELKNEFVSKYSSIDEYMSSKEFNSISNLLLKAVPAVVSDKNIIFIFKDSFEVVLFNKNEEEIIKLLKLIYKKKYSIVAVTEEEWDKIKKEYIENTKKGYKYEYIEESKKVTKSKKNS